MENLKQDVNIEFFKFQGSLNHVAQEEDSFKTFKSRRGHVVEPLSHVWRRKSFVHESLKTSKGRSQVQPPPSPILIVGHKTMGLVTKAFNIRWLSLVKTKVLTHVWPFNFQDIKNLWR
jgi:hypothetical protein